MQYLCVCVYTCCQNVSNVREHTEYLSSALCLPAMEWYIQRSREMYDEGVKRMISCHKLIFDTHYLMRELLMAEQWPNNVNIVIVDVVVVVVTRHILLVRIHSQTKCAKLFEMMTYQLASAYKMYEIFSMSSIIYTHTFGAENLFKSCFDWHLRSVGENAISRLLYTTLKSFNCKCQPK